MPLNIMIELFKGFKTKDWALLLILSFGLALFVNGLYISFVINHIGGDIPVHCIFASDAVADWRNYPANFGLYLIVNVIANLTRENHPISSTYASMSLVLAFLISLKYIISTLIIRSLLYKKNIKIPFIVPAILGLSLIFLFAIPYRYIGGESFYYIGSFVPNVWHNSTIIASIPFSLLLFLWSAKEIEDPDRKRILWISILVFLHVCVKPSYVFIYASSFSILFFIRYRLDVKYLLHYIPVVVSIAFVVLQWVLIYQLNTSSLDSGSVEFEPLKYWNSISSISKLPLALAASVLAPLLGIFGINRNSSWMKIYATLTFIFGLIIYLMFAEGGARFNDGNFYWQIVPATYILFLLAVPEIVQGFITFSQLSTVKKTILVTVIALYLAHLYSGLYYFKYIYANWNYI